MTALLLLAVAGACSTSSRPSELSGCVPGDGAPCGVSSGGGSSGGSGGDGGACASYADASACDACAGASCCTELTACSNSTPCTDLYNCETACAGSPACNSACQNQSPTGLSTLNLLFDCLSSRCPVCAQSGVGDPCSPGYPPCESGLTCNGDWCTKTCVHSTDCAGIGTAGTNLLGEANSCMILSGGYFCSPGCEGSATHCAYFPSTYCQMSTTSADNQTVSVCATLPDAGPKD